MLASVAGLVFMLQKFKIVVFICEDYLEENFPKIQNPIRHPNTFFCLVANQGDVNVQVHINYQARFAVEAFKGSDLSTTGSQSPREALYFTPCIAAQ